MAKKRTSASVGFVSLKLLAHDKWQAGWWDVGEKRYVRRIIRATSYGQAVRASRKLNEGILGRKGYVAPSIRGGGGHTVGAALIESIRSRRARPETKRQYVLFANQFSTWLAEAFPGVAVWGDLRPLHLEAYLGFCEAEGYAFDTIRLRFAPIRAASLYMADNYEERYRDIARKVRLPAKPARRRREETLDDEGLATFLKYASERRPDLAPILSLQALAGARVLEALAVRECDVDVEAGTVAVVETPIHKPKTSDSTRTIPVCGAVLGALRWTLNRRTVAPAKRDDPNGYLFGTRTGGPWGYSGFYHAARRLMRECARDGGPAVLETMTPRDLRAVFATLARTMGADSRVVQAYLGQRPSDVLGQHYETMTTERLRDEIVARFDASLAGRGGAKTSDYVSHTYIGQNADAEIIAVR